MSEATETLISSIKNNEAAKDWQKFLAKVISTFDCVTGTLHFYDKESKLLKVVVHQGIPPFLIPKIAEIPVGKGIAGIAAERKKPVEMCNLQTDESGVARPAAKETKVEGSIAVPLLYENQLFGTLGIAKPVPYDFTDEEQNTLMKIGEEISLYLIQKS
ncbi:MAG TPA: GAF domain-containing protein [Cytophagales bacterium]|nr:GAF domain-containing protein [Cytophagales bacterium]